MLRNRNVFLFLNLALFISNVLNNMIKAAMADSF